MLNFVLLKETTCGVNIKNTLYRTLTNANVSLKWLLSIEKDKTIAMVEENVR